MYMNLFSQIQVTNSPKNSHSSTYPVKWDCGQKKAIVIAVFCCL